MRNRKEKELFKIGEALYVINKIAKKETIFRYRYYGLKDVVLQHLIKNKKAKITAIHIFINTYDKVPYTTALVEFQGWSFHTKAWKIGTGFVLGWDFNKEQNRYEKIRDEKFSKIWQKLYKDKYEKKLLKYKKRSTRDEKFIEFRKLELKKFFDSNNKFNRIKKISENIPVETLTKQISSRIERSTLTEQEALSILYQYNSSFVLS